MFLRILKRDLKRKKTMNVIMLLFIILSTLFVSSSVNNIVAVMGGLDKFFEKAGLTDYIVLEEAKGDRPVEECLAESDEIDGYSCEHCIFGSEDFFEKDGERLFRSGNTVFFMPIGEAKLNYFDEDNRKITSVDRGDVYITAYFADKIGLDLGDRFDIIVGKTRLNVRFTGILKDAVLGSEMFGNPRFMLNDEDFSTLLSDEEYVENLHLNIYYISTDNAKAVGRAISDNQNVVFSGDISLLKMTYIMDMMTAMILLIVSVCLIIVSFIVLRFTIGFTISEEFREIGVMKAMGLKNSSIRLLYLVKYVGIAVIGAFIGCLAGIPFGNMLIKSVSKKIVLESDNSLLLGMLCSLGVVLLIVLFCWRSTAKIKKLSPIDAVRSGQTGERFRKKGILSLGKSRLGTTGFLATNDVLSSPKQFSIITVVFTICTILVMILDNTVSTLNSEKLLYLFGTTKSDLYMSSPSLYFDVDTGKKDLDDALTEIEDRLAENGMPAKTHVECLYNLPTTAGDEHDNIRYQHCSRTKTTDYPYTKGSAPAYADEVALTQQAADDLGVKIGDKVTIDIMGNKSEYTVSGIFESMSNLGKSGRLHQDAPLPKTHISGYFATQIDFTDDPDDAEIARRAVRIKKLFDSDSVLNASEFVEDCTGVADMMKGFKNLTLAVTLIIVIMISVLMERSFIAKEKSEIALMKALGFRSRSIIAQHTLRFVIVGTLTSLLAALLCRGATKLAIDPIFKMMGADSGVTYEMNTLRVCLIYPAMIVAATLLGAAFTALYTRTIKASDTADIE
ncbi:MAG: FtsX-like permease family protein [Ruminococcus sp.]|nr:FtsX-like permease family protein [Ruminococcus sp.]